MEKPCDSRTSNDSFKGARPLHELKSVLSISLSLSLSLSLSHTHTHTPHTHTHNIYIYIIMNWHIQMYMYMKDHKLSDAHTLCITTTNHSWTTYVIHNLFDRQSICTTSKMCCSYFVVRLSTSTPRRNSLGSPAINPLHFSRVGVVKQAEAVSPYTSAARLRDVQSSCHSHGSICRVAPAP